uniref:Secreted protein n=1 Tax=Panagrellus redivivus TaxID=6233 RepID=A0A7E4VCZ8_PANRE
MFSIIFLFSLLTTVAALDMRDSPREPPNTYYYHFRGDLMFPNQDEQPVIGAVYVYDFNETTSTPGKLLRIYSVQKGEISPGYEFIMAKRTPRRVWIKILAASPYFCFSWHGFNHLSDSTKIFRTYAEAFHEPDDIWLVKVTGESGNCATYDAFVNQIKRWNFKRKPMMPMIGSGPDY